MPDEIPLQEIARQIVKERFYHALVRCWHYFRHNNPAFRKAEQQALNNPDSYEQHKKELRDIVDRRQAVRIVDRNQPAKIIDFSFGYPLAIFEVLDQLHQHRQRQFLHLHGRPLRGACAGHRAKQRGHARLGQHPADQPFSVQQPAGGRRLRTSADRRPRRCVAEPRRVRLKPWT